ncbi:hypothetical protein [Pelagibius sp. Alg239-R121]|uniref:hypothetical protein n=1 Tax=Pelagibius sp. Alg239-R121 TaxID=2993448 RepID=UPI0024A72664|nr:hypothetical protein [Pelagibius sp. Alg239-R121]
MSKCNICNRAVQAVIEKGLLTVPGQIVAFLEIAQGIEHKAQVLDAGAALGDLDV